jgi:SulP family sulfate permease
VTAPPVPGTRLGRLLPIARWLPRYRAGQLPRDALAALSVWAVLVPQVLAYATIAGMPVQYGMYAALGGLLAYPLFGTSRLLVTAPTATVAATSAAVVGPVAAGGSPRYIGLSAGLALAAGLLYLLLGLLRAGWIANFLSRAVLGGFVFGFAVGIAIEQASGLLGVPLPGGSYLRELVVTLRELPRANPVTLAVGAASLAALLVLHRFAARLPRALIVVALATALSAALHLSAHGVAVTGPIPARLFTVGLPAVHWQDGATLLVGALSVIFVGFSESLAAARAVAARYQEEIVPNTELVAQGTACLAAGVLGGFAVSGSLTKTSVAENAGQRTQIASLLNGGLVLLTLVLLAGLLANLPVATLAAVVVDAVLGLLGVARPRRYLRVSRRDFAVWLAAMAGILVLGIMAGILVGVVLSLLLLIARASNPPLRRLGVDPLTGTYVDAARHPGVRLPPGVLVVRLDGPLFFADAHRFREGVTAMVRAQRPAAVVLDMASVSQTDTEGADALIHLARWLRANRVVARLTRVESDVLDLWRRAGVVAELGGDGEVYANVHDAVAGRPGSDPH